MFKDDLVIKDQAGELGAFRVKTSKQASAEALQAVLMENRREFVQPDIDEDNDYVDALKKNTIDDAHYDEESQFEEDQ